ncbi:MAG: hypothetical protein A2Z04_04985 [Chloroflexi bacterium RBG_16_57_9]|nr:MAG: hypothetical protein A2Z04_04985 [Chloroflexi bacterium RBG_16_57_9]
MLDKLRDQISAYLAHHDVCILSTAGTEGAWAMPVRYRSRGLEVECLVPRWADVAYYLEQDPRVLLVIQACGNDSLRWLQYRGRARPVSAPNWVEWSPGRVSPALADDLYLVVHVTPERIDLFDESRGWGARETLESGT